MAAVDTAVVDEERQSRTLYVLGTEAMARMASASVFLSGLSGVGVEIAKNVILTGVKSFTIHDTVDTTIDDLSTQCLLKEEDVGKNRAAASASFLAELNPGVSLHTNTDELNTEDFSYLDQYTVVILVDKPLSLQVKVNEYCRSKGIRFLSTEVRGVFGWAFVDFGNEFEIIDKNGEEIPEIMLSNITTANPGVCTTLEHRYHDLEDGDTVEFREVAGMEGLNGTRHVVRVIDAHNFSIGDTTDLGTYEQDGIATQVKVPFTESHKSLADSLTDPEFVISDFAKFENPGQTHLAMRALHSLVESSGSLPAPWSGEGAAALIAEATKLNDEAKAAEAFVVDEVNEELLTQLAYTAAGCLSPLVEFLGGFMAQECLKALTAKFTPLRQFLFLDAVEVLPPLSTPADEFQPRGDRYDAQRICLGEEMCGKLANCRAFMVGAGAIGCEMLKNLALLGVGSGDRGSICITDNDVIETSNLSRQFLFRAHDVTKPKSECAAAAATAINPSITIDARLDRVGTDSENVYTDEFFADLDVCINALDNVKARLYMDGRCVSARRPLLESGTLGTKGHVQVIVPDLTESYASTHDPPERDVPFCTIKSFPYEIQHTIQYARDKFAEFFANIPNEVNKFFDYTDGPVVSQLEGDRAASVRAVVVALASQPETYADCVSFARLQFEKFFNHSIRQLLHAFPLDTKLPDGSMFWSNPKRPPHPIDFEFEDPVHREFILHTSRLWAQVWGITPATDDEELIRQALANTTIPPFVPKEGVKIETDENAKAPEKEEDNELDTSEFERQVADLRAKVESGFSVTLFPEEFEKDDNSNSHIDFVASLSNLRARNYSIPEADRLKTKGIAGKIIPAISTTTAAVSGLVTLELIKILKGCPIEHYKNMFLNLALPILAPSEPGEAPKIKVTDDVFFTLWDTWDIQEAEAEKLSDFVAVFAERYNLTVKGVFLGAAIVYLSVMPAHKKRLKKTMRALMKLAEIPKYADLTVSFVDDNGEEQEGPTVRYFFASA